MNIPTNLKYAPSHEWLRVEGEEAFIGITDYAQSQLGDIVFVDIDCDGETLVKEETFASIEAVKTVADVVMPVGGTVLEVNPDVRDVSDIINKDPYGDGWLIKIKISNPAELNGLLDATAYQALLH
ncbi:MAG: glycine cleavage system protein GcvH [Bacteroidales bacterium]|nr:glycine cleavage system protein GcvH [Bacteroidales bacterium]